MKQILIQSFAGKKKWTHQDSNIRPQAPWLVYQLRYLALMAHLVSEKSSVQKIMGSNPGRGKVLSGAQRLIYMDNTSSHTNTEVKQC